MPRVGPARDAWAVQDNSLKAPWTFRAKEKIQCLCEGGRWCTREDPARQRGGNAIPGLHCSWVGDKQNVLAMARPSQDKIVKMAMVDAFLKHNIGMILNLQEVLAGTIQFSTALQLARSALLPAFPALAIPKVAPLSPGEVLGCTAPVVTSAADAIVFVADGRFHLEAIMIANPALPAYRYDPYARQLTREHYDQAGMRAARRKAVERAGQARHWGLVLGTLGRQGNPHLLDHLRDELQSSGARTTTFLISELSPARLALVPDIDAWVQVACPRLSIDWGEAFTQPCLTPYEALVALGKVPAWWLQSRPLGQGCQHAAGDPPCSASNTSREAVEGGAGDMGLDEGLQPYPMDYYSKTGGAWNSSWHKGTVGGAGKGRVGGLLPHQKPSAVT